MKYTIFVERNIESLRYLLKHSLFEPNLINKQTIEIDVSKEKMDSFIELISLYISTISYKDNYKKLLKKNLINIEDRVVDKIASIDVENNDNKLYIVQNLNIMLKEYFKNNDILCIDTFITFNTPGFKKDISLLTQLYCDTYDSEVGDFFLNTMHNLNQMYPSEVVDIDVNEAENYIFKFENIKMIMPIPEELINITRLDLINKNGKISLLANENMELDFRNLKQLLHFDTTDETIDINEIFYIVLGTLIVLDIEQIVIHKNLSLDTFQSFLKNLLKMKDLEFIKNTSIYKCKGISCSKCNP